MQQTENLKLNLIETGDPISPVPLNENAQKIEAALTSEATARQTADAALDARLAVLELKRFAAGTVSGNGTTPVFVDVGFSPRVVVLIPQQIQSAMNAIMATPSIPSAHSGKIILTVSEGGFSLLMNALFAYIAFG